MPLNRYLQFALNSHFAERNIYIAVITRHFFPFWTAKKFTSSLFFEHIMYTFFDRVCEMKSQFWHSFKWNVACIEWKSDCIKCKCVSKYTPNTNCEASNGVENRGKFFDSDYFHFVQSQRKPKQIKARANDIKRVRILIQTDIIAKLPPMMIAICSRSVFVFLGLCFWHARLMHPHMCTWSCLLSSEFEFLIWIEMHCTFLMLVDTHTALTHSSWLYQPTHFDTQNESNDEIFRLHEIHKRALCTQSY